jgi:CHRD domain
MNLRVIATGLVVAILGASSAASAEQVFRARLSGENEVPPVTTNTAGRFEILVNNAATAGQYTLRVDSGVRVTQSHFHCGAAGANGPVIVFLAGFRPEGWDVDGQWVGNTTITDANIVNTACGATLAEIFQQARLGNVYVNVHSVASPGGLARGQLLPSGED